MSKYAPDSPPDDRVSPCDVCGGDPFGCDCEDCPECGSAGDPGCAMNGGRGCRQPPLTQEPESALATIIEAAKERLRMSTIKGVLQAHGDPDIVAEYERECSDAALLAAYVFLDAQTCSPEYAVARKLVMSAPMELCAACGGQALVHHDVAFIYASPTGETDKVRLCERCWFEGDTTPTWTASIRQRITERRASP